MKKKIFTLLTLLLAVSSSLWADSVIFSMTDITSLSSSTEGNVTVDGTAYKVAAKATVTINATLVGGTASVYNNRSDAPEMFNTNDHKINLGGSTGSYVKITLTSETIKEGDVITIDGYTAVSPSDKKIKIKIGSSSAVETTLPYTVPSMSGENNLDQIWFYKVNSHISKLGAITITRPQPATPVFNPVSGSEVAQGAKVTVTSTYATTIQYKWTADDATPADGWTDYTDGAVVPEQTAGTPYLHVQCTREGVEGVTTGYAQYTITGADTDAPVLESTVPANAATDIAVAGDIVLTFDENVACTTNATLTPEGGEAIELTPTVSGATVTYSYSALAYEKAHTFNLAANSVADVSGNQYASAISFSFTTAQEVCAEPVITAVAGRCFYITCATAGATIYYTVDDDNPVNSAEKKEYTLTDNNILTIDATTGSHIIYAYAEKTGAVNSTKANKDITIPGAATTTGSLLMTLSPEVIAGSDTQYDNNTFTKAGYTLSSTAYLGNTDVIPNYHPMFKANAGTLTVTAPDNVTIQSIKVYLINNADKSAGTIGAIDGISRTPSDNNRIIPRYTYYEDGTPAVTEYSFAKTTANNKCQFAINNQSRLYVEVYGTTSAETATINVAKELTTYVPTYNLDFTTKASDVKAYIATGATTGEVTMTNVNIVPAGTPVVLKATTLNTNIAVPVTTSTSDVSANKLKCGDGKTSIGGNGKYDYVLSNGKFYHASAGVLAVGKCYLHLDDAPADPEANFLTMNFDGETTAISEVSDISEMERMRNGENETFFDLQGRRIAQPTKGLYIVNGKKVIVK